MKAAGVADIEAVRRHPSRLARFTPEARETSLATQAIPAAERIFIGRSGKDRRDSIAKLDRLFEYLLAHPEKIPRQGIRRPSPTRAVCDFIAGMTDRYFLRFYDTRSFNLPLCE